MIRQSLAQRPVSNLENEPRFLQQRNESSRRYQTLHRVLPANQGLKAADVPTQQIKLRLIVQDELLLMHGLA